jgi:hypothetical protein
VANLCTVSEVTLQTWWAEYGAVDLNALRRMKVLKRENAPLKRIVAGTRSLPSLHSLREWVPGSYPLRARRWRGVGKHSAAAFRQRRVRCPHTGSVYRFRSDSLARDG